MYGFTVTIPGYPQYLENTPVVMNIADHRGNSKKNYVFIGTSFSDGAVPVQPDSAVPRPLHSLDFNLSISYPLRIEQA